MLPDNVIERLCDAVFAKPDPWVAEHYSEFDEDALTFESAASLASYLRTKLSSTKASAAVAITYPDMGARAIRRTIRLTPGAVPGRSHRTEWTGWGVIYLQLNHGPLPSRVSVNSRKRAEAWASTCPDLGPPEAWNWKAVESHARRLQRVLRSSR